MKNILKHGLIGGLLASIANVIFLKIYETTFGVSYHQIINIESIVGASFLACLLMALGYFALEKINKPNLKGVFNLLVCVLSFASIISPIMMTLPYEIDFPELFPGLVIPMHFLPALAFMSLQPFFQSNK